MKWYSGPEGDQRIWYEPEEIEQIADDELRRASLVPTTVAPVTDLERFVEVHLKADLDQYADLEADILGLTQFDPRRRPAVSINRQLTEAAEDEQSRPGLHGRWRATLAHEAAHVLLHRYLFDPDLNQIALFEGPTPGDLPSRGLMRCLKRDVGVGVRASDWREVQANRGMAALLMPRAIFRRLTFRQVSALSLSDLTIGSASATALAASMAELFEVSQQAAAIRLETIGVVTPGDLTTLPTA